MYDWNANDVTMVGPLLHDEPLGPLCQEWLRQLKVAGEHKKRNFGDKADESLRFYSGSHEFLYEAPYLRKSLGFKLGDGDTTIQPPMFRVTANLTAEFVQIYGPMLFFRNPVRTIKPRIPPELPASIFGVPDQSEVTPEMAQQMDMATLQMASLVAQVQQEQADQNKRAVIVATLLDALLNYTPHEFDLKGHSRKGIVEALIKGRGLQWIEKYKPPTSNITMIRSVYDTVDNLVYDPDAEDLNDAWWVARRCIHPTWWVEEEFGLPKGTLRGNRESLGQAATYEIESAVSTDRRKKGDTQDLMIYYRIYSRMGMGGKFKGPFERLRQELDQVGDYVYLVVADNVPYPLNIPRSIYKMDSNDPQTLQVLQDSIDWPIPFWADSMTPWPFAPLDFHTIPRSSWPMAHMTGAMVYQKFLDWSYSMLMSKMYRTHRDLILVEKGTEDEVKEAIQNAEDQSVVPVKRQGDRKLSECVEVMQFPEMVADNWQVTSKMESLFQRSTGLTEVMYGDVQQKQMRSAEEAQLKGDFTKIRPDDMASCVEDWQALVARKEALASRWCLAAEDVEPILGKLGAAAWRQFVESTDISYVVREFEYRIEAGSTKKPNVDLDLSNSNDAVQFLGPVFQAAWQATGDPSPFNALVEYWAKPRQLDASKFMLQPLQLAPPPLPGAPPSSPPGSGGGNAAPPPPQPPPGG